MSSRRFSYFVSLLTCALCGFPASGENWYQPAVGVTWQWQLKGTVNTEYEVELYDVDLFDSADSLVTSLQASNKKVICYFSAGSYENWRSDIDSFNPTDLGNFLDGWPDEQWLDIRSSNVMDIMKARLDLAVQKGCDGVEPDNVDGYINDSGFPLTAEDQLTFNRSLAEEAHSRNLSIGLKNDLDQIDVLVDYFDFSVNEQCFEFDECSSLNPFIEAGKPVLNAEYLELYSSDPDARGVICAAANLAGLSTLVLPLALDDAYRITCQPDNYYVDTGISSPLTGLWWNADESGWGITLTQQFGIIFLTMYTYDTNGQPVWYVASNCVVVGKGCSGEIYRVVGGSSSTESWDGANLSVEPVGSIMLRFTDDNTGFANFRIDGVTGSKAMTRQEFATLSPGSAMTGLWWNPAESGWGVTLTQQTDIIFATLFTYDANNNPVWYVASNCIVTESGCSGKLYDVVGGSDPTSPWDGANKIVTEVGVVSFAFSTEDVGEMNLTIGGVSGLKTIQRQVWSTAFSNIDTWMYQIQGLDDSVAISSLAETEYPMLVVEPGHNFTSDVYNTSELVQSLRRTPSGQQRLLLAYIDIGQAEDYRTYWQANWIAPTANSSGTPDWLVTIDPDGWSGNYPVAYWRQEWKDLWLGSDGLIAEMALFGFDGVYLDWIEAYDDTAVRALASDDQVDPDIEMIKFIEQIKAAGSDISPGFLVVAQNAAFLIDADPARYVATIDALAVEDTWFAGAGDAQWTDSSAGDQANVFEDEYSVENRLNQYKLFLNRSVPVFTVDYCISELNANQVYADSRSAGLIPLVTRVSLSQLTETPPPVAD
jgi:cysteinyl-tRNA synthetase, unknown class